MTLDWVHLMSNLSWVREADLVRVQGGSSYKAIAPDNDRDIYQKFTQQQGSDSALIQKASRTKPECESQPGGLNP